MLIFCFALAHAGTLGTDNTPATAISYSSIRFGTPNLQKNTEPIRYVAAFDSLKTTEERLKIDEISMTYKTLDQGNPTQSFSSFNNAQTAPMYTEAILPQYVPSGSRVLNLAKPILASRNIPQSPSPEFNSVPSVLKTEGLSAYASFPIETSTLGVYSAPMTDKALFSSLVRDLSAQTVSASDGPVGGYYSAQDQIQTERFLSLSSGTSNQASKGSYSETPISHVSVSSAGTNYSW